MHVSRLQKEITFKMLPRISGNYCQENFLAKKQVLELAKVKVVLFLDLEQKEKRKRNVKKRQKKKTKS